MLCMTYSLKIHLSISAGLIHGDITISNIIVSPNTNSDQSPQLQGIIDFGDALYTHLIYEISAALASIMECQCSMEPIEAAGHFLAGYQSIFPLDDTEKQVLYVCVLSRMAQVELTCVHDINTRPKNGHIEEELHKMQKLMDKISGLSKDDVERTWRDIALKYQNEKA